MSQSQGFTISEFAKYSRTTKDTLLHYDRVGLLSPMSRGKNKYRFYSPNQLVVVNTIRTLQELGLSLAEISDIIDKRTPHYIHTVLNQQIEKIDLKIDYWSRARDLLFTLQEHISSGLEADEANIAISYLPERALVLGDLNDYSQGGDDYTALNTFYHATHEKYPEIHLNYPVWGFFSKERVISRDWKWPDRFYFYTPEGSDVRPAGLYAIGYTRGDYGQCGELYERMLSFIEVNGFEVSGDAYEEYPLNEVCISDRSSYLIRLMIAVTENEVGGG